MVISIGGTLINDEARALVAKLNKEFGEGSVVIASDIEIPCRFPTGSLSLDVALGGGWPGNQWVEVIGKESHGKTAIVLKTVAANQQRDKNFTTLWVAGEHYDKDQAAALGVDNERVLVVPTQDMEFAYQTILTFVDDRSVDCVVLDSYPALLPSEEEQKGMDEVVVALGARLTSKFIRKAGKASNRSLMGDERPFLGIMVNQMRDKIGGFSPYGTPQTTPGGNAKNYFFYTRVQVSRDEYIVEKRPDQGKVNVGQTIKVKTIKNKSAPPQQVAAVDFYFRDAPTIGFKRGEYDEPKEIIVMGILFGIIKRRGAYFTYGDQKWQGKNGLVQAVREDLTLREAISAEVMEAAKRPDLIDQISDQDIQDAESAGERKVKRSER